MATQQQSASLLIVSCNMINLIPPEGQKVAKREYVLRVFSTMCVLFGFIAILLAVANIPTYVLIGAQINSLNETHTKSAEKETLIKKIDTEVQGAMAIVRQIKSSPDTMQATEVIGEIKKHTSSNVTLRTFVINKNTENTIVSVDIQGLATTRSALAEFKNAFAESKMFKKVEVPIADLVSETNVPFTLTMMLK